MTLSKESIAGMAIVLAAATTLSSVAAWAQHGDGAVKPRQATAEQPSIKALEAEFWACDYAATTGGIAAGHGEACVANYEALKTSKFGGDFAALMAWWQANKGAKHLVAAPVQPVATGR